MAFLNEDIVRARSRMRAKASGLSPRRILEREARVEHACYDVFLSQAIKDDDIVLGVYTILTEDIGLTVFCDWIENPVSDHSSTTAADAEFIRQKMAASTSLMFIDSEASLSSTWMSWEIGWFHGAKRRVCVLPIVRSSADPYRGREFLGLYPAVEADDRFTLRVPARTADLLSRYGPGTAMGIATWMPFQLWATAERLPDMFLP